MCKYHESDKPVFKEKINSIINKGKIILCNIELNDIKYFTIYMLLKTGMKGYRKKIGEGEAAVLTLARKHNGAVASDNLKDIAKIAKQFNISYITTWRIFKFLYKEKLCSRDRLRLLWKSIINKNSHMPYNSFDEYLNNANKKINDR